MTVADMLDDLLDVVVSALPAPPARRFVAHGDFAHDCAQVAVRLADYLLEPQTDTGAGCAVIPVVTFETQLLLDCWPTATQEQPTPPADKISEASRRAADAGEAMLNGVHDARTSETLFTGRCCDDVDISSLAAIGPEGGLIGWTLTVAVRL